MKNPYYDEFTACNIKEDSGFDIIDKIQNGVSVFSSRLDMVRKYAWAIPDEGAIEVIKKYGPIVEMGAGTGYWANVLSQAGVDIIAYDSKPFKNGWCKGKWFKVKWGRSTKLALHSDRALFLCWPPYSTKMAINAIKNYLGDTLIYVGESTGGCTADDSFFSEINKNWVRVERYEIPQWPGLHDYLNVYKRKK